MNKRTLIVLVVAGAIVLTTGGTGFAKGPESAALIGPNIDAPIELTHSDPAIGQLMQHSGIWFETSQRLPSQPAGPLGPMYTLTWLNSGPPEASVADRSIRQLLYPYAENGPLIHTPAQGGLGGWGPEFDVIGWFTAPQGLVDTLVSLGVQTPTPPPTTDLNTPDTAGAVARAEDPAVSTADPDRDTGISKGTGDIVALDNEPDSLVYLTIIGFGLFIALGWAARRRQST